MKYDVATFYRFVSFENPDELREQIEVCCRDEGVRGTILVAMEGINATISGPTEGVKAVLEFLRSIPGLEGLEARHSAYDSIPFQRLKVKVKDEIVTLKAPADPNKKVGRYLSPGEWNDLLRDPEVLVIDTRNDFEYEYGTFEGAVNPKTTSFGEFPGFVQEVLKGEEQRKIAMFCTGGIRCEKATSYLLDQGFEEVYHLKGGILRYLDEVEAEKSLWKGDCFVFDEREVY